MIYYYNSFENGKRRVIKYDENISGPAQVYNNYTVFLYHRAVITSTIYNSETEALESWGKYSWKPVIMPDGSEVVPVRYFHVSLFNDVLVPYSMIDGELWPGEY